ncbi:hypothetical protein [Aquisphaera insulae]|uniref:hypothetical protein n=1 Tax=Aquisphaera insulae TaxID=2712864 RepID=UPI0013EB0EC5|nr:hypothetical protein [Aquisphaera insulae]
METFKVVGLVLLVLAGAAALLGLHRLALRLEDRGVIYYLRKKPKGGVGRGMLGLQEFVDPRMEHVLHVREEPHEEAGSPAGPGDPPRLRIPDPESR